MEAITGDHIQEADEDSDPPEEVKVVRYDKASEIAENQTLVKGEKFLVVKRRKSRKALLLSKKTKLAKKVHKSTHIKFDDTGNPVKDAVDDIFGTQLKNKKSKAKPSSLKQIAFHSNQIPPELASMPHISKYWAQRYRLFSKYDQGVRLDEESW
jgi:hypothetical protein